MWKANLMRSVNVLNGLLIVTAAAVFVILVLPVFRMEGTVRLPEVKAVEPQSEESQSPATSPALADYSSVHEKNLFHPERRLPVEKEGEQAAVRPEIVFYGSIITHDQKVAYIEDVKNPYSTPGRGKRQPSVTEGTVISGYTLKEIFPESIVLVSGEDRMLVRLRDFKERKPAVASHAVAATASSLHAPPSLTTARPVMGRTPPPVPVRPVGNR